MTPMLSIDDQKIQPSTHGPMLVKVNVPQHTDCPYPVAKIVHSTTLFKLL